MTKQSGSMSFEESRKALLDDMTRLADGHGEDRIIRFPNDDVPVFLRCLDAFEARARRVKLMTD